MRRPQCSEAVMWMAERFRLLSATHNRAVAQVQHNQDSPVDEKYTKWPSAIRQTRRPRREEQGPRNLGEISFQQAARDKFEHVFTNLTGLAFLTYSNIPLCMRKSPTCFEHELDVYLFAFFTSIWKLALKVEMIMKLAKAESQYVKGLACLSQSEINVITSSWENNDNCEAFQGRGVTGDNMSNTS